MTRCEFLEVVKRVYGFFGVTPPDTWRLDLLFPEVEKLPGGEPLEHALRHIYRNTAYPPRNLPLALRKGIGEWFEQNPRRTRREPGPGRDCPECLGGLVAMLRFSERYGSHVVVMGWCGSCGAAERKGVRGWTRNSANAQGIVWLHPSGRVPGSLDYLQFRESCPGPLAPDEARSLSWWPETRKEAA